MCNGADSPCPVCCAGKSCKPILPNHSHLTVEPSFCLDPHRCSLTKKARAISSAGKEIGRLQLEKGHLPTPHSTTAWSSFRSTFPQLILPPHCLSCVGGSSVSLQHAREDSGLSSGIPAGCPFPCYISAFCKGFQAVNSVRILLPHGVSSISWVLRL